MPDDPPFMDSPELQRAQATMGLLGRMASSVEWERYVATVEHAETIGPLLDPTAWMRSPHALREETTELARLMLKVVEQWRKCSEALDAEVDRQGMRRYAK